MSKKAAMNLADDLVAVIEQIADRQEALHDVMLGKLEAMRRGNVDAMIAASNREGEIVNEVTELDRRRRALAEQIAATLAQPGGKAAFATPTPTLRHLAARLGGEHQSRLSALTTVLREKMLKVAEANRVVELVSREMLAFFRGVFTAMVTDENVMPIYSPAGSLDRRVAAHVLDAMG